MTQSNLQKSNWIELNWASLHIECNPLTTLSTNIYLLNLKLNKIHSKFK